MKARSFILLILAVLTFRLEAEPVRVYIAGEIDVSLDKPEGAIITLSYIDTALIRLKGDVRFFRGIQLDLTAPQGFLAYRGSLGSVFYADSGPVTESGALDINARQISFEALPNKILNTWQIPLLASHGLRNSPYITVLPEAVPPASFPVLFRLTPVIKGISEEIEEMIFHLQVKPIFSDEGAVKINFTYPPQLQNRPFTVLIDDEVIEGYGEELLLKEGEHHLLILSEDYRNQSRRFLIERAKILDLQVELQDPTPLLIFESPEDAQVFVDSRQINDLGTPYPVEPGVHEVRFQMSNYAIVRPVTVQRGKTYRIALSVDINITENE